MALTTLPAGGLWLPKHPWITTTFASTLLIDATGEKAAFYGPVWTPNQGTKSIRKVGFRFGAVTKAGGSALTVSLQDVDLANGPPGRPDGTPDQTVAIANANASFAANTWIQTGNLSADRSVNFGELLSVVIEFDGAGRLGADSVVISAPTHGASQSSFGTGASLFTASWVFNSVIPNVLLEFSDGTFGCLMEGAPISNINTHVVNSGSAVADEFALEFQVPWECQVDAAWATVNFNANTSDCELILYDGTTPMTGGTITLDANVCNLLAAGIQLPRFFSQVITLQANTTYRLAVRPTTANNISVYSDDVASAAYMGVLDGGTAFNYTSRLDLGSWAAPTVTRRFRAGIRIIAVHASSGLIGSGRLTGGLQ